MTARHPAAPETETETSGAGNALDRAVDMIASLTADLDAARERVRVVEGERDAAVGALDVAPEILRLAEMSNQVGYWKTRAESAEAAHEAEKAAHERLRARVEALAASLDRGDSIDRGIAADLRSLLGGGGAR